MNELLNLIDKRIEKHSKNSKGLISVPCRVLEIFSNNTARVLVLENGVEYTVPNYSGSDLLIGENVQLFCQGNISLGRFMYIGAAVNKQNSNGSSFECVVGSSMTGEVFSNERDIVQINVWCKGEFPCLLFFNATVLGSSSGNLTINSYIDDVVNDFTIVETIQTGEYSTVSFSLPLKLSVDKHIIRISAIGVGNIVSLNSYVIGSQIEEYDVYEPTGDNDYTYLIKSDHSNIVYYIGKSKHPKVPTTLQGFPVKKLLSTSFNYSDVINVYIPEGVEEIE